MTSNITNINISDAVLQADAEPQLDKNAVQWAYFVTMGVIIFIGFICNVLSIAVFIRSKALRESTTGLYLGALAVADILFLIGELLRWLGRYNYIPSYTFLVFSDSSCQFVHALRYSGKLISAWITVVITAQRFFIVAFPLKAGSMCTRRKAYIGIVLTYLICFLCGSIFPVYTLAIEPFKGSFMCGYTDLNTYNIMSWIFLRIGSLILPGILITILTILICVILAKARSARRQQLNSSNSLRRGTSRTRNIDTQLTVMLLSVAVAFIALRLPYTILFYVDMHYDALGIEYDSIYLALKISDLFASLNYALNFFLYCLSGSTFRHQFLIMFHCDKAIKRVSTWTAMFGHSTGSTNMTIGNGLLLKKADQEDKESRKSYPLVTVDENGDLDMVE